MPRYAAVKQDGIMVFGWEFTLLKLKNIFKKTLFSLNDQECKPSSSTMVFLLCIFFHLKIQLDPCHFSVPISCYLLSCTMRIVTELSLQFLWGNCWDLESTCFLPLTFSPYSSLRSRAGLPTWHIQLPAAGGAALRAHKCLEDGAHKYGAWHLLGKNKMWLSESLDISTWQANHIHWIIHSESKGSVTPFYVILLPSCFHLCIKLNSIAVEGPILAAWKIKSLSPHPSPLLLCLLLELIFFFFCCCCCR